jgi:hypothetical protein
VSALVKNRPRYVRRTRWRRQTRASGSTIMFAQDASPFAPQTTTLNTAQSGTVITIPSGATTMQIDCYGGTNAGGTGSGSGCSELGGGGASSSSLSSSSYNVATSNGLTISCTVGAIGAVSSVASGTFAITAMSSPAGIVGGNASGSNGIGGAAPAVATGGNVANTAGNAGSNGSTGAGGGGNGGAPIVGAVSTGPGTGHGGAGAANTGRTLGNPGIIVIKFT